MNQKLDALLDANPLVPVVVLNNLADAKPAFEALRAGGITCAEVTFRTPIAAQAIQVCAEMDGMTAGAGTVINAEQARQAVDAGAQFIVSPGWSASVYQVATDAQIPYLPGCVNASQIMLALEAGLDVVKFFPAIASGGLPALKALHGPFPQVSFVPTGGISASNLAEWITQPFIRSVGGSWMITTQLVQEGHWEEITRLSAHALQIVKQARS